MRNLGIGKLGRVSALAFSIATFAACGDNGVTPPDAAPDAAPAPAVLSIMPMSSDFGSVVIGTSSTATAFTVRNTGEAESGAINAVISGAASDYSVANGCTTLVGGGSCVISVTFTPTTVGTKAAMLLVTGSPGGSAMANLTGVGQATSELRLAPQGNQSYGDVLVGATGTAKVFTVTNTGGQATGTLTVQGAGDTLRFPKTADTCNGMTLAAGAMCSFTVNFAPNASGPRSATYVVSGNPGGSVTASVSGNGQDPAALTTTSTLVPFGTVNVGASSSPVTIVFTNSGDVPTSALTAPVIAPPGEFTITNENCTGAVLQPNAGNSCSVIVTFSPIGTGARPNRTLTVTATTGGTVNVTLTGSGSQPGALTSNPSSRAYGNVAVGTMVDFTFTITNPGTTTVTNTQATTNAPQYTIVAPSTCQGATLASMGTCTVTVRFTPSAGGGQQDGTLTVSATGAAGSAIVPLTGAGVTAANISISPPGTFGSVVIGTSVMRTFTVTNNGGTATPVPTVTLSPGNFTMNNGCTAAIAPNGGTCTIVVTFSPTAPAGTKTATLTVTAGNTVNHALTGDAITNAQIVANPGSLNFDPTLLGDTSMPQTFTLTNNGSVTTGPITLVRTGNADFAQTNNCTTLAQGASCTVNVTFAPTATGARTATFTVNTGAGPGGGATVVANGTGVARIEILTPATNPYDFGTVNTAAGPVFVTVVVRNNTNSVQTLDMTALNPPFFEDQSQCGAGFDLCCTDGMQLSASGSNVFGIPIDQCNYRVAFDPNDTQNGPQAGSQTYSIGPGMFDAATQQFVGVGNTARLAIAPDPAVFGSATNPVAVNTNSAPVTLTIRNQSTTATGPINISAIDYPWHVTSDMCTGMSLAAGGMCTITVVFRPNSTFGGCNGDPTPSGQITVTDSSGAVAGDTGALEAFCDNAAQLAYMSGTGVFGNVFLNTTPANTFVFTNPSAAASAPVTVAVTGSPQFTRPAGAAGGTCGTMLAPSGTCTVIVLFTPVAASQDMLVTGNLMVSGMNFPLSGTPRVTVSKTGGLEAFGPTSINGGVQTSIWTVVNNSPVTSSVTSITSNLADFTITNNGCGGPLAMGDTCQFTVRFAPTTAGAKTANISINAGPAGAHGVRVVPITGTAATAPDLQWDPISYNFGSQRVTAGVDTQSFRLTNVGQSTSGAITLSGLAGAFSVAPTTCVALAPGASCTVVVTFDPTGPGLTMDTLIATAAAVPDTVPGATENADVSGTGVADTVGLSVDPSNAYYNPTVINPAVPQTVDFTVTNSSGSSIALDNTLSSAEFVRVNAGTFPPGAPNCGASLSGGVGGLQCTVRVAFVPTTAGTKTATLTVSMSLNIVAGLYGTAFNNTSLSGIMNVDFGNQEIAVTSTPRNLLLTNTSTATIDNLTFAAGVPNGGDFMMSGSCVGGNVDLDPNESCTLTIVVTASATGPRSSTVTVTSANGLNTSFLASATGNNHPSVSVVLTSGGVTDTRVVGGVDPTPTVYTVTNLGGATTPTGPLNISLAGNLGQFVWATTGLTNPCAVQFPNTAAPAASRTVLAAGASCQVGILFNPTSIVTGVSTDLVVDDPNTFDPTVTISPALTGTSTEPVTSPSPQQLTPNVNRNIVFTNNSSVPTTQLDTFIADNTPGLQPDMLSIVMDGCLGTVVAAGASCTIVVRLTPDMSVANPPMFTGGFVEIYGAVNTTVPPFATATTHVLDSPGVVGYDAVRVNLTP